MTLISTAALVAAARSGCWLVGFPTDTVPALAVRPDRAELIFAAKQRSLDKPLILMAAAPQALWPFVAGTAQEWSIWQTVAQHYWPGALTLVLPASQRVPPGLNPTPSQTIGLRVPRSPYAQMILEQTGPLATTSINRSGYPSLKSPQAIEAQFPEVLIPLTEDWQQPGAPSTVAQWSGGDWEILRQGSVTLHPNSQFDSPE